MRVTEHPSATLQLINHHIWYTVYPKKYAHGFCFVVVIHWLIFPYPSGLLHWHCGNLTIAPVPAKQPWWIWINTSCKFIMNDCITTTKQSTTKTVCIFLGIYCMYPWIWGVSFLILSYHVIVAKEYFHSDCPNCSSIMTEIHGKTVIVYGSLQPEFMRTAHYVLIPRYSTYVCGNIIIVYIGNLLLIEKYTLEVRGILLLNSKWFLRRGS